MKFLLSVIAVCLILITAKLYIPIVQAQECGTFDDNGMYIICYDNSDEVENKPEELKESPTLENLDKRIVLLESDLKKLNYWKSDIQDIDRIKRDVKALKNKKNKSDKGLTAKEILDLVDDNCRANVNGAFNNAHPHSLRCKDL
jgi:molecular chaperone GrpE (heat shock protein)